MYQNVSKDAKSEKWPTFDYEFVIFYIWTRPVVKIDETFTKDWQAKVWYLRAVPFDRRRKWQDAIKFRISWPLSLSRRLLHCRSRRVKHVPWDIPLVPLYLPRLRRVSFRFRIGTWIVRTLKRVYVVVVPLRHVVSHERPSEIQYGSIIDPLLRRYSFGNTKGGLLPFDSFQVLQKSRTIEQRSLYLTRKLRNRQQPLKLVYFYNKTVNRTHSRTWSVGVQRY